jgi:hypothetical protein
MKRTFVCVVLMAGLLGVFSSVWAATINVPGDYSTIQAAIDAANPAGGDVINVADGTYTATSLTSILIDKSLSLIGQSRDGTIIDAGSWGTDNTGWPRGIQVKASNVTIKNLTVQGFTGDMINTGGYGIVFRDWDHDTSAEGYIYYTGGHVENVKLQNNYSSLYALVQSYMNVHNCLIQNSYADGMFIARFSDHATITDNTVLNSANHGIWVGQCWQGLGPSGDAVINGNTIDGAVEGGISFYGSNTAEIKDNYISNVFGGGWSNGAISFMGGGSNIIIDNNTVFDNIIIGCPSDYLPASGVGIGLTGTMNNITISNNNIFNNAGGGIKSSASVSGLTTSNNKIYLNSIYGVQNTTGSVLDFKNTWWGDASGPYHATTNTDGLGNAVSNNVTYDPWWTDSNMLMMGSNSPVINTTQSTVYSTIQSAINDADPGDMINVAAGTYTEDVLIIKPLTLIGANANIPYGPGRGPESIIQPVTSGGPAISNGNSTTNGWDNVTINGFEITGPLSNNAIYCGLRGSSNLNIVYNYIHHIGTARTTGAVYAVNYRCSELSQTDINISYNYFDYIFNTNINSTKSSAAIWMGQSPATGVYSNVLIEHNTIKHAMSYQGSLFGTDDNNTSGINIGCGWKSTGYLDSPIIQYNVISDLTGGAVYGIALQGNTPGASILYNTISNLFPLNTTQNAAGLCVFQNVGYATNNGTGINAHDNSFTNTYYGIYNATTNSVDGIENWWGDATGPYHATTNTDGLGTAVSDNVVYDPWWGDDEQEDLESETYIVNQTQDTYFTTIQAAINAASSGRNGDVIEIPAGTYDLAAMGGPVWEPVSITKSLTLRGAGSALTILDATGYTGHCDVVAIRSSNVVIEGMTITEGSFGIRIPGFNYGNNVENIEMNDVSVVYNAESGLVMDGAGTITGLEFVDCSFDHNGTSGDGRGIYSAVGKVISDISLTDCSASYNSREGVHLQGTQTNLAVTGGDYSHNIGTSSYYGSGITLQTTNGAVIDGISAVGNGSIYPSHGIYIKSYSTDCDISNCDVSGSRYGILYSSTSANASNHTTGNVISDCQIGLADFHGKGNTHTLNDVSNCDIGMQTGGTLGTLVFEDNIFGTNEIQFENTSTAGTPLDLAAMQSTNSWPGGYFLFDNIIYGSTAEMMYVDAPETLIKDEEEQTYSVKLLSIEGLRAFTARIVIPKVDFAEPDSDPLDGDFTLGPLFGVDSFFDILDHSDVDNWIYDVSGAMLGGVEGIDGSNVVLFTVELTSLLDRTNLPGSVISLPLAYVELRDDQNPYQEIPCLATESFTVIIDATEPTMDALTETPGETLAIDPAKTVANGFASVVNTYLGLSFEDNYNLDYLKFKIQPNADADPDDPSDFSLEIAVDIADLEWVDGAWQIPDNLLNAAANDLPTGDYEIWFLAVDDAGNFDFWSWNFLIDKSAAEPAAWTLCRTTPKQDNSIDLAWTNPGDAVMNHIWYLDYASLPDATGYPEYGPASDYTIPAAPNPYSDDPQNGWTKGPEIAAAGTYTWTGMDRGYYYLTVFVEDINGNLSAAPVAPFYRESISYWPGDVAGTADGIAHTVTSLDIAQLSANWGLTPGNNIVDVGPTVDNGRRSRPEPDNLINIEDLMIFAMNYNNTVYTFYPRTDGEPRTPIRIEAQIAYSGDLLNLSFVLGDNEGFLRGLNIPLSYGSDLSLDSVALGDIWPEGSLLLYTDKENLLTLSLSTLGESALEGNGVIATASFKIDGNDIATELHRMLARDLDNGNIQILNNPTDLVTDNDDMVNVIPVASYLADCYPNPFNPTTTVRYGLKDAGSVRINVYNSRGQLVRSLVNDAKAAGTYSAVWNGLDNSGRPVSSGLYFIRMEARNLVQTKKALLMK